MDRASGSRARRRHHRPLLSRHIQTAVDERARAHPAEEDARVRARRTGGEVDRAVGARPRGDTQTGASQVTTWTVWPSSASAIRLPVRGLATLPGNKRDYGLEHAGCIRRQVEPRHVHGPAFAVTAARPPTRPRARSEPRSRLTPPRATSEPCWAANDSTIVRRARTQQIEHPTNEPYVLRDAVPRFLAEHARVLAIANVDRPDHRRQHRASCERDGSFPPPPPPPPVDEQRSKLNSFAHERGTTGSRRCGTCAAPCGRSGMGEVDEPRARSPRRRSRASTLRSARDRMQRHPGALGNRGRNRSVVDAVSTVGGRESHRKGAPPSRRRRVVRRSTGVARERERNQQRANRGAAQRNP
jgi:hypothetical protein